MAELAERRIPKSETSVSFSRKLMGAHLRASAKNPATIESMKYDHTSPAAHNAYHEMKNDDVFNTRQRRTTSLPSQLNRTLIFAKTASLPPLLQYSGKSSTGTPRFPICSLFPLVGARDSSDFHGERRSAIVGAQPARCVLAPFFTAFA